MKVLNEIKRYFEEKARYWYIVAAILVVLGIANYGFLYMAIPLWGCNIITIVLVILATTYIAVMYNYVRNKYKNYMSSRKNMLFERIESLQGHIDELDERNTELENKLTEALHNSIDENTAKTITKLSTAIDQADEDVKNRIQEFDVRLSGRLDKDVENIQKQMANGFTEQKKQAEENTKALTSQMSESTNKLQNHVTDTTSNLTDAVSEFHKEQMEKTAEFKTNFDNQFVAQGKLIDESSDLIKKKINESALASSLQTEELNSSISALQQAVESETKNLADVASDNMVQITKLFEEQTEKDTNNNSDTFKVLDEINVLISSTGKNTDNVVAEALCKIIANADENRNACEAKATESRTSQEAAEQQIQNKIAESDATTATLIDGLAQTLAGIHEAIGQDTEHIIKSVEDNTTTVIGKIQEKTTSDSKSFEEVKQQISTTEQNLSITTGEVRELVSSTCENEIKQLEETKTQILSQASQLAFDNKNTLAAIESRIVSDIKEATTTISELSIAVSESITELGRAVAEDAEKLRTQNDVKLDFLRDKIQDVTLAVDNGNIANIDRINQAESSITYAIEESKTVNADSEKRVFDGIAAVATVTSNKVDDMWNAVAAGINSVDNNIKSSDESIVAGGKAYVDKIISEIEKVKETQSTADITRAEQYKALEDKIGNLNVLLGDKTEDLSMKTSKMQNEITKLMVQILDDQDDDSEKAQSAYDRIFNQIVRFTNDTKSQIMTLQGFVASNKEAIESVATASDSVNNEQLNQTTALKDKVDTYSKVAENYQREISIRLENLQNQVLSLNSLAEVLKNISVTQKQADSNEKIIDPNRIEEIKDAESGVTVFNNYKNNILVFSEMRNGKQKTYDVEYDVQGRITRSRNYGPKGDITTELQFYPNGQVKTRIEIVTVNGRAQTVTSQFDEQGNKK